MSSTLHFYSCDWGTTSFRLRLVAWPESCVLDEIHETAGVRAISASLGDHPMPEARAAAFGDFLARNIRRFVERNAVASENLPIIVSGMASSSVGWVELPYATTPFPLDGSRAVMQRVAVPGLNPDHAPCWIVSGVRTDSDVIRGEECEIMGLLTGGAFSGCPNAGVIVLPGTHSKHVHFEDGLLRDFRTFMTGEVGDVLANHSLLRASVTWPPPEPDMNNPRHRQAFIEGVTLAREEPLLHGLFRVRTRALLDRADPGSNGWFLSGLLVGSEIRDLLASAGESSIVLAGSPRFASLYAAAMDVFTASNRIIRLPPRIVEDAVVRAHATLLNRVLAGLAESVAR